MGMGWDVMGCGQLISETNNDVDGDNVWGWDGMRTTNLLNQSLTR